jgi:hypothetical protein
MSSQTELEQRLAIVVGKASAPAEVALSQLQQQISTTTPSN